MLFTGVVVFVYNYKASQLKYPMYIKWLEAILIVFFQHMLTKLILCKLQGVPEKALHVYRPQLKVFFKHLCKFKEHI